MVASQSHELSKLNCYIRYLKSARKVEANFSEHEVENEAENCEEVIKEVNQKFLDEIIAEMTKKIDTDEVKKCVKDELVKDRFLDYPLKTIVFFSLSATLLNQDKVKKAKENDAELQKLTFKAFEACGADYNLGLMYDYKTSSKASRPDESLEVKIEDFCARKYLVESGMISPAYNLVLNPYNADVSNVNCLEVMKGLRRHVDKLVLGILTETNGSASDCALEFLNRARAADYFLKTAALTEVKLTDEQNAYEKIMFLSKVISIFKHAEICSPSDLQ